MAAWLPNEGAAEHLLDAFAFPETLKRSFAQRHKEACEQEVRAKHEVWAARARTAEPRVVVSAAGRKCVQFIDAAGRQTVFLQTRPLAAPLPQPVTIFCVAIAFDEVTYLSGVHNRFEICHAYAVERLRDMERAPVAMTAHPVDDSSDTDEPSDSCVVTGLTRPGEWHVYTAGAAPALACPLCRPLTYLSLSPPPLIPLTLSAINAQRTTVSPPTAASRRLVCLLG